MTIQIPIVIQINILDDYLDKIKKLMLRFHIDSFISYSWGNDDHKNKVLRLRNDLTKAGIYVFLDLKDNEELNDSISAFIAKINCVQYVILAGSDLLMHKYTNKIACNLNYEIQLIRQKHQVDKKSVVGINLNDDPGSDCLPNFLKDRISASYTNDFDAYSKTTLDLLKYFAPEMIKNDIQVIIETFKSTMNAIKFNMSARNFLEWESMNSLQLVEQTAINVDDLLKKWYLQAFDSNPLHNLEKINLFESFVYLAYQEERGVEYRCDYDVFFDDFRQNNAQISIQGDPGIGKSTLCKLIAYSWASNEKLLDFKFVFFIKTTNLNASRYPDLPNKRYKLIDIVLKECFAHKKLTDVSIILLTIMLNDDNNKILWLIDNDGSFSNMPIHLNDLFCHVINSRYIIVTSRNHVSHPHVSYADVNCTSENYTYLSHLYLNYRRVKKYQIIGFNECTQKNYIDFFFDAMDFTVNERIKIGLLHFLSCNYLIKKLFLIPMYLENICSIWLNKINHPNIHINITDLYESILIRMVAAFIIQNEHLHLPPSKSRVEYEISSKLHLPLLALKKISFFIQKKNCDIFTLEELQKQLSTSSKQTQMSQHLLEDILKIGVISQNGNNFKFTDPSLKIFFVAKYLIDGLQQSTNSDNRKKFKDNFAWFVSNYKYIKNNHLLFVFASGLLNSLSKNNDFAESLYLKENIMLFWKNIFNNNLDFVGINHICLLLKCLKETDHNMTLNENPEIKSYICLRLPKILQYICINNIAGCIDMFLSVFNDLNIIEIIINLDLLKYAIYFISHTDKNYSFTILSNWIENGKLEHRQKILFLVQQKLLNIANITNDMPGKYLAVSIKEDKPTNEDFLIGLLQSNNLKNKRTALEIIVVQELYYYNKKIETLLKTLAANIDPERSKYITEKIVQIDLSDDQQLIDNKEIIKAAIEMDRLSFLCLDLLYDSHGYTSTFLGVLGEIYKTTTSPSIRGRIISIVHNFTGSLETEDNVLDDTHSLGDDSTSITESLETENEVTAFINNYQTDWQTLCLHVEELVDLKPKILEFLISNNIFLLNTPLINLINAYASVEDPNKARLLGTLVIKRIFFNCQQEVLTIKNRGIMVYDENLVFLEIDSTKEGNFMGFINEFGKLFYTFAKKNNYAVEHEQISFTPQYESQICGSKQRSTYVCAYPELSEPSFKAIENSTHSEEQGVSDEMHSYSSIMSSSSSTFTYGFFGYSNPQIPISTEVQDSIATTIARQRLILRG